MNKRTQKRLSLRISEKRLNKLKDYAALKERTITDLVYEWIDHLTLNDR